ncbi:hypothetical protein [Rhodococcus sp. NPDC004095]
MSNEKHLAYIGELAVTLGIGLAVAAPVGVAAAAPADNDSGTSSSVGSSDGTSAHSGSADRTSHRDSQSSTSNRNSNDRTSDNSHSNSSTSDNSTSDSPSNRNSNDRTSDSSDSNSTRDGSHSSGIGPATGQSTDDTTNESAPNIDTSRTAPDASTAPAGSSGQTVDGGTPAPDAVADGAGSAGPDAAIAGQAAIDNTAVDNTGTGNAQSAGPAERADSSGLNSLAPSAPAPAPTSDSRADTDGTNTAGAGGPESMTAVGADQASTESDTRAGTEPSPAAVATNPAMRGPAPNAQAALAGLPGPAGIRVPPGAAGLFGLPGASPAAGATLDAPTALSSTALSRQAHGSEAVQTIAAAVPTPSEAAETASRVVSSILGAVGLSPHLSNDPLAPIESPTFVALAAAWCRRQETAVTTDANRGLAAAQVTTSQPVESFGDPAADATAFGSDLSAGRTMATAFGSDLSAGTTLAVTAATGPVVGAPDRTTGKVSGTIDPAGSQLGYAITGQPSRGSAAVDATGTFTYTPTSAARQAAALDPSADYDSFIVTVTSGQTSTPVTVQVPVSAARMQLTQSPAAVGSGPAGAAFAKTNAYVANPGSRSVSVLDSNNTVIRTVTVGIGTSPTAVAAKTDGSQVYVTNSGSGNLSVIDTGTNTVVKTVTFGTGTTPNAVAVNPKSSRAYVTLGGTGKVAVIDTANNTVVKTVTIGTGTAPNAVAVNPAGTRAYVTLGGTGKVAVIDTTNNTVLTTVNIGTGTSPNAVAVNPTGTRAYVTLGGTGKVAVIDTVSNTVAKTVAVGARPTAVSFSSDGSAAYVVTDSDRLWVIDTATGAVVSDIGIDTSPEAGAHSIVKNADGTRWLVTDAADGRALALSLTQVNSAPSAASTVGTPRASDGAVTITIPPDPDGDPVTVTYASPASGSVVTAGVGAFVYTPTQATRDLARQTPGAHTDTVTLTVGDGQYVTNVAVTVPISPAAATGTFTVDSRETAVGSGPSEAVLAGDRLYVVSDEGSVSVIDRNSGQVVGSSIAVDWASSNIAASPLVNRVYVNSPYTGTVSVIDTTTGTVVDTLLLPTDPEFQGMSLAQEMAVNAAGTRLYTSGEDGTVSVIDTATNTVVISRPLGTFTDLAVSKDGSRLYGTNGAAVTVIDTQSMTAIRTVSVGPAWDLTRSSSEFTDVTSSVAVNATGTRAYATYHVSTVELASGGYSNGSFIQDSTGRLWRVTGGYEVVAVIDVDRSSANYGTQLAAVRLPEGAQNVAISADGRLLYVSGADGRTVSVVDASNYAVLGTFVTDPDSSTSEFYGPYRSLIVDPGTGTLYVTDYADAAVYAVTGAPGGQPAVVSV